jgi:carbonic anhydrase/acetyltransferase-like protein (isoleucine patch superfamily)
LPIYSLDGHAPRIANRERVWIAPDAQVIGKVILEADVGVWYGAVLRGDNEPITVGAGSNVQEHVVMHTDMGFPLTIGAGCTIGHRAVLHGCTIGTNALIGIGAVVMNGARIGDNCLVGAGALVTEGKEFDANTLIVGAPARAVRTLDSHAISMLRLSAAHYVENARRFAGGIRLLEG